MKKDKTRPLLQVSGVYKSINRYPILRGIDLNVPLGEFLVIMGESGSGKSTFLSILSALDFPDEGVILVDGEPLHKDLPEQEILDYRTSKTGFIYQDFNLIPTLTLEENITFPATISGRQYSRSRLETLLKEFGLKKHRNKFPDSLSGGEMQRTAIVRSILLEPVLLFADEPTGNLDSKNSQKVISILEELNQEGITIILVTHSRKVAKSGSRIVEMSNGKLK